MNAKILFVSLSLSTILLSCTNDNPDTLMDDTTIIGLATYNQNVKSIIDNNCIVCHATVPKNGAPMSLVTYDQVKQAVLNRGLLTRISLENGNSSLMPNGGPRLPQTTIDIILKWNQDGLLEK
ncbi:hypothetical protein [Flavobacterium sp. 5]|uniref:hypothetical protein n=1 Tax=Flavobacterium sp. 5 TaxID=2035199 RepID=UPI000C2C11FA|nr:hypothetical protein [Flavobacterium sp. 5]PKB16651.1 hypothetical protein CLU82_1795 [Flavobacterium sp. 5]